MRKAGIIFIILGVVLLGAVLFLYLRNDSESDAAGDASAGVLEQLMSEVKKQDPVPGSPGPGGPGPVDPDPHGHINPYDESAVLRSYEMQTVEIDGHAYIGWISFPSLELELPVMAGFSYDDLRIAPCRLLGSVKSGDLIIAGHNYRRHFRDLDSLHPGDFCYFVDVEGQIRRYIVTEIELLGPTEVQRLKDGDWDMTVFTCTYGGAERITVRFAELPDIAEIVTAAPQP